MAAWNLKMFDLVDKLDRLFPVPNTVPRGVDDFVLRGPKKPSKWFMCSWNYLHVIQSLGLDYFIANIPVEYMLQFQLPITRDTELEDDVNLN